jgi:hypothetical protein
VATVETGELGGIFGESIGLHVYVHNIVLKVPLDRSMILCISTHRPSSFSLGIHVGTKVSTNLGSHKDQLHSTYHQYSTTIDTNYPLRR